MARGSKASSISALFDYGSLEASQRSIIQQRTGEIRERLRRSAKDVWEIGEKLSDVRSRLQYGQFLTWLKAEFGWSQRTAYNFIKVYETFADRFASLAKVDIATSLLYQLASPSVPEKLRNEVLAAAEQGKKITATELRTAIKKVKQLTPANEPPVDEMPAVDEISIPESEVLRVVPHQTARPNRSPVQLFSNQTALTIEAGWYRLGGKHMIFAGDTAGCLFLDGAPMAKLALAFTGSDWDHDWLIEQADNVVVLPQDEFSLDKFEQLLCLLSGPKDQVILPWLPHPEILYTAHR
ncbi:MAG: DUF3102 domain-containing protein, partial [Symploca sp. SIO2G7]|nr:DUF3102 domain-containing protein [Symploca sp. SIO2G7]